MRHPIQKLSATLLLTLLTACGGSDSSEDTGDAVATWNGGNLSLAEVEERFPQQRSPACRAMRRGSGEGMDGLLPCYRETAEALVAERLARADIGDLEAAIDQRIEADPELLRQALLNAFHARQAGQIDITDEEVEALYESTAAEMERSPGLMLWNLFRRHGDDPETTMAFLRELKARAENGESFTALAREHSHSETRLTDGRVGRITEGVLPPQMEQAAFALAEGEISEPIAVKGGAMLLLARQVEDGGEPAPEAVRRRIRFQLRGQKMAAAVEAHLSAHELPKESILLSAEELIEALDRDEDSIVLRIGELILDVGAMREIGGLDPGVKTSDLPPRRLERLAELYRRTADSQRLYLALIETEDSELQADADEHCRQAAAAELLDERSSAMIEAALDADPEQLTVFFEDNRELFQSTLRFRLQLWSLPIEGDGPALLASMQQQKEALDSGQIELQGAVAELGGSLNDLGWRTLGQLPSELPAKARSYLLQTAAGACTEPFYHQDTLYLLWIEEREDPRPLEYEQVATDVRASYLQRNAGKLAREVVAAAGFRFQEETTRRLLKDAGAG